MKLYYIFEAIQVVNKLGKQYNGSSQGDLHTADQSKLNLLRP